MDEDSKLRQLVESCWNAQPKNRPDMIHVYEQLDSWICRSKLCDVLRVFDSQFIHTSLCIGLPDRQEVSVPISVDPSVATTVAKNASSSDSPVNEPSPTASKASSQPVNTDANLVESYKPEDFLEAARTGDLEWIQSLLKLDKDLINSTNEDGMTALLIAIESGHLELVQWLLTQGGASIRETQNNGETAYFVRGRMENWKSFNGC